MNSYMQLLKIIFVVENAFSFFSFGLFLSSSFSFVRVRNLFLVEENIQKIIKLRGCVIIFFFFFLKSKEDIYLGIEY